MKFGHSPCSQRTVRCVMRCKVLLVRAIHIPVQINLLLSEWRSERWGRAMKIFEKSEDVVIWALVRKSPRSRKYCIVMTSVGMNMVKHECNVMNIRYPGQYEIWEFRRALAAQTPEKP